MLTRKNTIINLHTKKDMDKNKGHFKRYTL